MKYTEELILIFSVSFLLLSNCKENLTKINTLETIDIESNIDNFKEFKLSQINADIIYVPLKSDENHPLSRIDHIDATSDMLLVSNTDICFIFDYNGNIIRKISEKGRGPDEYSAIINSCFGFNENLFIQNIDDFMEYKVDGTLKGSFSIKAGKDPLFYMMSWIPINDSLFLGQVPLPRTGNGEIKAIIFDNQGITRYEFKNYIFLDRPQTGFSTSEDSYATFFRYRNRLYFKEQMNDTLFSLTDNFYLHPEIRFNIGKYSKPKKYRQGNTDGGYNPANFVSLRNIYETQDFLFIDCDFGFHTPAKRITPVEFMGIEQWYNTQNVLGLYDKANKSLSFCKPTSTDNPLFTTGIYNDIDAGPRFYPFEQINDSTMVMIVEANQLKDHVDSDDFKNTLVLYPEKKSKLKRLVDSIDEFDNPILMFVILHDE